MRNSADTETSAISDTEDGTLETWATGAPLDGVLEPILLESFAEVRGEVAARGERLVRAGMVPTVHGDGEVAIGRRRGRKTRGPETKASGPWRHTPGSVDRTCQQGSVAGVEPAWAETTATAHFPLERT